MRRRVAAGAVVLLVLGLVTGGLWLFLTPGHRTTFLVDASDSPDFREVADAVGTAAANMATGDALALRKFGGSCDSPATSELVAPGTGQAGEIGAAARAITPSGRPTVLNGLLAAIDDFAGFRPLHGNETNRIVLFAHGGLDMCGKSLDEVRATVGERAARARVTIEFRFVGHRLTPEQTKDLNTIAAAANSRQPPLPALPDELVTTMKEISVPSGLVAGRLRAPCDEATPEVLAAAHPLGPDVRYFDIRCQQDRYVLSTANTTPARFDDLAVLFEYKDQAWRYLRSGTVLPCLSIPAEVWTAWGATCEFEAVVCRDGAQKVTDLNGVGCTAAIDIADRYRAATQSGQAEGQGLFWTSGEWSCSWPYEGDLAHFQIPLKCVRTTDNMVVQLGDYQR
ncbi:hypothetical protein SAMN04488074_12148 [Lentzea albidocapillata subsp. violacea]|uniref:VWFA domain-containing protein n=1 Tax=Lentzea albidocapillata subsp. violacea TaxID=128104 RepID=A0A1G9T1F9_9PSEU|nr:hypothetical protein [Lentzea albidocapillata]SDM41490.1 hypothetical protein SAMN04488074_12148 [Lentzea albidocapillata subsp. violacea]